MNEKFNPSRWVGLSEQQLEVIKWVYEGKGSLELLARAGCGKTFTLMKVVDAIVSAKLGDVAIMAYNKKIADEIKVKLEGAKYDWRVAQAGTVHSFGFQAWRKVAPHVQIDDKKVRNIVRDELVRYPDAMILTVAGDAIAKMVSLAKQRAFGHLVDIGDSSAWMDIYDHFGIENDLTEDVDTTALVSACKSIYRISMNQCREVIDFDDMILAPLVFKARFWPKDWILVDESQDTNPARRALALAMLKPRTGRMIFVGDPAQAIYGFTGADSDSMNQLKSATNAKTLPLNVTRRCPKTVVALAARLVPDFTAHEDAPEGVVRSIEYAALDKEALSKTDAILCRNTAPLVQTAYSLIAKGIACRVEGREIGSGLIKLARRWKLKTLDKLLAKLDDYQARQTAKFMSRDQEDRIQALVDQVDCLRIVISTCQAKNKHTIDDLVADIESMFGNTPDGQQPQVLTLSTVHKSKGREWTRVYLLGRERFMPSPYAKKPWQLEQEKNLEYVAITRAMSELIDVPMPVAQ
jgi:DNA helicase-2/ATP-dependent DNA helicase PcrA